MLEHVKSELASVMECCFTVVTGILFTDLRIVNLELMFLGKLKELKIQIVLYKVSVILTLSVGNSFAQ